MLCFPIDPTQPVVIGGHAYPNAPGQLFRHPLCPWLLLYTPPPSHAGVTLSVGTTAVPQPLSEQGIHQVVENMAAQDKSVYAFLNVFPYCYYV